MNRIWSILSDSCGTKFILNKFYRIYYYYLTEFGLIQPTHELINHSKWTRDLAVRTKINLWKRNLITYSQHSISYCGSTSTIESDSNEGSVAFRWSVTTKLNCVICTFSHRALTM